MRPQHLVPSFQWHGRLAPWALALLSCAAAAMACGLTSESALVGRWDASQATVKTLLGDISISDIEFFKEGTVTLKVVSSPFGNPVSVPVTGNWRFVDRERVRLEFGGGQFPAIYHVSMMGDELTLTDQSNQSWKFRKTR